MRKAPLSAFVFLALVAACSGPGAPGHTFEIIEEDGVPVAVSSAVPKFEGELFTYEKILELRTDPDNMETLLYGPRSFTLGDDGFYYVADNGNNRIAVFDAEGNFVRAFGSEGEGPGEMRSPTWVNVRDGVVTVRAQRTSRFRTDGTFIDIVRWEGGGGGLRLTDDGTLVVIGTPQGPGDDGFYYVGARARVIGDDGEVAATIETTQAARGKLDEESMLGQMTVHYAAWPRVFVRPQGVILASEGEEPVVSWYGLDGALIQKARIALPLEPVTDADIAAIEDRYDRLIENGIRNGATDQFRDNLLTMKAGSAYPENKAHWSRTHVEDPGGWIWLTIPAPEFGVYVRNSPRIQQQQSFRILGPEGEYIGITSWPAEVGHFATNVVRGHLLAMVPDPETEEEIPTVYRIRPRVEGLVYR